MSLHSHEMTIVFLNTNPFAKTRNDNDDDVGGRSTSSQMVRILRFIISQLEEERRENWKNEVKSLELEHDQRNIILTAASYADSCKKKTCLPVI